MTGFLIQRVDKCRCACYRIPIKIEQLEIEEREASVLRQIEAIAAAGKGYRRNNTDCLMPYLLGRRERLCGLSLEISREALSLL